MNDIQSDLAPISDIRLAPDPSSWGDMPAALYYGHCSQEEDAAVFIVAEPTAHEHVTRAKAACMGCVALERCRIWALGIPSERDGNVILGGMTREERDLFRLYISR